MKVPQALIKARAKILLEYSEQIKKNFQRRQIGRTLEVIWRKKEKTDDPLTDQFIGTADNYVSVVPVGDAILRQGARSSVVVKGFGADGELRGRVRVPGSAY